MLLLSEISITSFSPAGLSQESSARGLNKTMKPYLILIGCARQYWQITPDNCLDPVNDCRDETGTTFKDSLLIYACDNPEEAKKEIDKLTGKINIPPCPKVGCKRFLTSTVIPTLNPKGYHYYTLEELADG